MIIRSFYALLLTGGSFVSAIAQNEEDILRYSFLQPAGDARNLGLGSSMSSTGANISAASYNPAGLGLFRSTSYSISGAYTNFGTNSTYIGFNSRGDKGTLNIPNMGVAFTAVETDKGKDKNKGLVSYTFMASLNRINNFNRSNSFSGINRSSSIADYFAERSYGIIPDDLQFNSPEGLAYWAYLFDPDSSTTDPNDYVAYLPDSTNIRQKNSTESRGRMNAVDLALGFNISNRLYLGASLTFNTVYYENSTIFSEEILDNITQRELAYEYAFTTGGNGILGKFGAIYRHNDYLRFGLAYHTKSRMRLEDYYNWRVSSNGFKGTGELVDNRSEVYTLDYRLTTPARTIYSATLTLPKKGFFSIDVERVKYGSGTLNSAEYAFAFENAAAKRNLATGTNIRTGFEVLDGFMRYRLGYVYQSSPFTRFVTEDRRTAWNAVSVGLGYRNREGFFADFAIVRSWQRQFYTPYLLENSSRQSYTATNQLRMMSFAVSLGSTF